MDELLRNKLIVISKQSGALQDVITEMNPTGFFWLLLVHHGEVTVQTTLRVITIREDEFATIKGAFSYQMTETAILSIVAFPAELALTGTMIRTRPDFALLFSKDLHKGSLDKQQSADLALLINMLSRRLRLSAKNEGGFYGEIITLNLYLILHYVAAIVLQLKRKPLSSAESLFVRFCDKVQQSVRIQHSVKFYADTLFITPGYLSKSVRMFTGRSAKHFIEIALLNEACELLEEGDTVTVVSDTLNFPSLSAFSQFFKKYAGVSPVAYRLRAIK